MREKLFIISDIEMGRGDIFDDFTDDDKLVEFIDYIIKSSKEGKTTLILNGDTFDFMKMAYKGTNPRHITEEISLWKLSEAFKNHPKVFSAFKKFLATPANKIHFIIGNHDSDLAWPALQEKIKEHLGSPGKITFDFYYKRPELHIEHGHLYDPFFMININKPFVKYQGQQMMVSPFGIQIFASHLMQFKKDFPYEEKCYPKHKIFDFKPEMRKHKNRLAREMFIKDFLINPIIHFTDPTCRIPYFRLLMYIMRRGMKIMDMSMFLPSTIRRMFKKHPGSKIYVLGHVHLFVEHKFKGNKKVLFTDTWRDEYDINRNFEKKKKSYAEIDYNNDKIEDAQIKVF
jgi:UDP-2,3-diacylglucosamine pyrophosphatase LpxH